MFDVINNDDLLSFIFISFIDPMSCFAVLLVNKRFNNLYRKRVPGSIRSSIQQHCSRVELCDWAVRSGMPQNYACSRAAMGGHLNVLQWLRSQNPPCVWDECACSGAAMGGHLGVLQWLRSQDPPCPRNRWACSRAVMGGHLDVLQWLRSQDPPCPWD